MRESHCLCTIFLLLLQQMHGDTGDHASSPPNSEAITSCNSSFASQSQVLTKSASASDISLLTPSVLTSSSCPEVLLKELTLDEDGEVDQAEQSNHAADQQLSLSKARLSSEQDQEPHKVATAEDKDSPTSQLDPVPPPALVDVSVLPSIPHSACTPNDDAIPPSSPHNDISPPHESFTPPTNDAIPLSSDTIPSSAPHKDTDDPSPSTPCDSAVPASTCHNNTDVSTPLLPSQSDATPPSNSSGNPVLSGMGSPTSPHATPPLTPNTATLAVDVQELLDTLSTPLEPCVVTVPSLSLHGRYYRHSFKKVSLKKKRSDDRAEGKDDEIEKVLLCFYFSFYNTNFLIE